MNNEKFLKEVIDSRTSVFITVNYDKSELVKLANFLRQHNLKCEIYSDVYEGMPLHRLTITKP